MRRAVTVCGVLAALAAVGPPAALAAPANILAGDPTAPNPDVFNPTTYDHDAGTLASLTWVAGGSHDADAIGIGPDEGPLFRTELTRSATIVPGTQYLSLGAYSFICTVHSGMAGTLNVNLGVPKPRPTITLKVKTKSLAQAVKKAEVKVKVTITGGSGEEAEVKLKLGKKAIGVPTAVTASRTVKIALTNKGHSALEKKEKASVKAEASIEFGGPATAKGSLK